MQMPENTGTFHIIGIGGIGMSAIAEIMLARGITVQGSDLSDNANVRRLRERGAIVHVGHSEENLGNARFVVVSSAVKAGNPELEAARARGLVIISRAEMLAELMRSRSTISITGTHGKTTTTSLIATILEDGGVDPTVINGGIINAWGSNARIGQGRWMVVEADESDGTFVKLPSQIGIVTNIDPEHMDYYGSIGALHEEFRKFFVQIPFYGLACAGIDHPVVREIIKYLQADLSGRRLLTYGSSDDADIRLENARPFEQGIMFDACLNPRVGGGERRIADVRLPVPGRYNAVNALAAIAIGAELGIDDETMRASLGRFQGVMRRFTPTGNWCGVSFFDDYAHHPVEIKAALKAAKDGTAGRVIAIMQPHRYTRLKTLFSDFCECFSDADIVVIMPVYSAGEQPLEGIDHDALISGIVRSGHRNVLSANDEADLTVRISRIVEPGDLVIGLGAGNITEWAHALPKNLANLDVKVEKLA